MAAMPLTIKAIDRIERRRLYLYCCLGMAVVLTLMFLMGLLPNVSYNVAGFAVRLRLAFVTALLMVAAPFVSVFLVVPRTLLADVMDYDEQLTGYRREAMYNGMESLLGKIPVGLAPFIMGQLFDHCGNTAAQPWGISLSALAAGGLTVLAWAAFLKYPLRK
jgi:GPH family glycoside/pentoside/hexuronide:cation symporter